MVETIGLVLFFSIIRLLVLVAILISVENKSIIRILKRLGIDVYVKDIGKYFKILQSMNKDVVAFIDIKGVCQCPVLKGDYSQKDINKHYSSVGEIHILENSLSKAFKSFSKDVDSDDLIIKDMEVIKGSIRNKNCTSMGAKFSLLRQYIHTLKTNNRDNFTIYEGNIKRTFKILYGVDLRIESTPLFSCKSRLDLLSKLESMSYYSFNHKYSKEVSLDNNIVFFLSTMDIDMHLVVAVEV